MSDSLPHTKSDTDTDASARWQGPTLPLEAAVAHD